MTKKFVKIALLLLMAAGVCFSAFNFLAVKSEAETYKWTNFFIDYDPDTGKTIYICVDTGQTCLTITEFPEP
jgi:hypothetical protein